MIRIMTIIRIVVVAVFVEFELQLYLAPTILHYLMHGAFMVCQINVGIENNESVGETCGVMA